MPTVDFNKALWDGQYQWTGGGDEWSWPWGGPEAQWFGVIHPRIHAFIPTGTVLEIAPGYGRWTQYLLHYCSRLMAVDLSESCVAACKQRFDDDPKLELFVNDGMSLDMIPDRSIDFCFSFDSLVHAEIDVIDAYLGELGKKLKPDGVGFIHHSAIGMHAEALGYLDALPHHVRTQIVKSEFQINNHLRARSVTAPEVAQRCTNAGLACISQELVNWREQILTDCFTTFTPVGSKWERPNQVVENLGFMKDADTVKSLAPLYSVSAGWPVEPSITP